MRKFILFCIAFLSVSHLVFSQNFNDEKTRNIVEPILNAVINSEVFDSVYHSNKVYFLMNDLIPDDNPWKLSKNSQKVKYITEKQKKKVKQYFVLGDFTLDWEDPNPKNVRVQLGLMPEDIILNFALRFVAGKWRVENHIIIFPDD